MSCLRKLIYPFLIVFTLFFGFLMGCALGGNDTSSASQSTYTPSRSASNKVDELIELMQATYVDELNTDSICEILVQDVVTKLDPHSSYISAKDLEMTNAELSSSFSGIGVQFTIQNDTVCFVAVVSGGPSEGVGLLPGDKVVMVDDSLFVGKDITNHKVMSALRGKKGTTVKLAIKRQGEPDLLKFTITRGDIPNYSVDAKFLIQPSSYLASSAVKSVADGANIASIANDKPIGFIRVTQFGENTYDEFLTALISLQSQGAESFIIDLRSNSGGYMDQAIRMVNEFLPKGDLIVYAEGRAYPRYDAFADGKGRFQKVPLVVLMDNFSASASEIFAGAMQDNDRATIIGQRSFGKGLVQQQFPFNDGSAVRLTVARYYTPSGRCIQKPYTMGDISSYEQDLVDRFEHGEFYSADSIHFNDTTTYLTKSGRVVRGGGGIMPDNFVGRDTTDYTAYYNQVVNRAYTYQFAYAYVDAHRKQLQQFKDWKSLENFLLTEDYMPEFVRFCKKKGVEPNAAQIAQSRHLLVRLINAYIVRDILGDEGFFPLFERDDAVTYQAVTTLSSKQ